jgi:hypothetical protein
MTIRKTAFAFWILWALCATSIGRGAEPESGANLDAAKREGRMVFYTSMDTGDARALVNGFEKKYPLIKTDVFRSGRDKVFARFSLEQKAGRHTADVISVGEFASLALSVAGEPGLSGGLQRSRALLVRGLPQRGSSCLQYEKGEERGSAANV